MAARANQTVPRIGRKGSVVPSALVFWLILIIICQQKRVVWGDCQVQCSTYCSCVGGGTLCAIDEPVPETTPPGTGLFNVSVDPSNSKIRIEMTTEDADFVLAVDGVEVYLNETLDYESVTRYEFTIHCSDTDGRTWSGSLEHVMTVEDENEFVPFFNVSVINASIDENAEIGTQLLTDVPIEARDEDQTDDGFTYSIVEETPFEITAGCQNDKVFLTLKGTVDFEDQESYNFTIVAADGCRSGFDSFEGNVTVIVQINDLDDEPPFFYQDNYDVTIPERDLNFVYSGILASDRDTLDAPLHYRFSGQSGDWGCMDYLTINSSTGNVTLVKELDYETSHSPCSITVEAVQADNCDMVGTSTLTVTVANLNECPGFMLDSYSGQLAHDDPFVITEDGSERLTIVMTDEDLIFNGTYTTDDLVELIEIRTEETRTRSYYIRFRDPTLITNDTDIQFQIFLSDNTTDVECDIATLNITVLLMSDSLAPNFTRIDYYGNVLENATEGTSVIQVEALNSDMTSDGIVYRLQMASDGGEYVFSVDDVSGDVSVARNDGLINAESIKQYTLIIEAVDERGTYYRSSITSVIIDVLDVNEFPPTFNENVTENVEEEVPIGFPVLTVQANDSDVNATLAYDIRERDVPFSIDPKTGEITTNGSLDRDEAPTVYNLTVIVTDGLDEDECLVTITLTDINDNAPTFTEAPYGFSVQENTTDSDTITATDIDEDIYAEIVYMLESPDGDIFSIDNETGLIYANGPFDYEEVKEYTLVISASDGKFSTVTTVTVTITDVNDNAPVFTIPCSISEVPEDTVVNDVICTVVAVDADNDGADNVTYTLNASTGDVHFQVNSSTGEIKVSAALDRETQESYTFVITAEDSGQPPLSTSTIVTVIVLDVNDNDPVFEDTSISIRRQQDELADPPVLLESVQATDDDLLPWNITNCEKTSGEASIVVLTGQDGSCEIYAFEELPSPDTYVITFYAFNPDNRDHRHSDNVTLSLIIRDTICYVTFVNESNYDVIVLESDLDTAIPVLTLEVESNCNNDDIMFEILWQSYQPDQNSSTQQSENFILNDRTGDIYPTGTVMEGLHVLFVSAYNQSDSEVNETTTVSITVTGAMNQPPEFRKNIYVVNITTDSMTDIIDLYPEVNDVDYPSFATGEIEFSEVRETEVDPGSDSEYFEVSPDGKVTTTQNSLNTIQDGTFELVVIVMDKAIEPLNDTTVVRISVDIDQTSPVVSPPIITKDCADTVPIEEEMDDVTICDVDASSSYDDQMVFGLDSASEYFNIEADTGVITTKKSFDYETEERSYTLLVYAEGTTSKLRNYTSITVIIIDINDNPPDFSESQLEFSMEENRHEETNCITFIGLIRSTDADSETNQNVTYETDHEDFEVRGNDLTAVDCISRSDMEYSTGTVEINITALNVGFIRNITTYVIIVVVVEDLNDYAPVFMNDPEDFSVIVEALSPDMVVFRGEAEDEDKGPYNNELVFSLADDQEDVIYALFHMSSDGLLTVRDIAINDDELKDSYEVVVMVMDKGQPPLNSTEIVTVSVGVFDLTTPYFPIDERTRAFDVPENSEQFCKNVPVPLTCSNVTDDQVDYELVVEPELETGSIYFVNTTNELCVQDLDREQSSSYTVTLTASYRDADVCNATDVMTTRRRRTVEEVESNTIIFTITVNDEIDSPPALQFPRLNFTYHEYYLATIDSLTFGSPVYTVTATDEDASWQFGFNLTSLSEDDKEGPINTITINTYTGQITTNSLLYTWLSDSAEWNWDSNFPPNRTQDLYNVTVCDNSMGIEVPQCDTAPLTFKILLSFEHIIIRFDQPVASIMPKQNDIISCIEKKMDPTNMLQLNLQFFSPVSENGISSQGMTDMWLYGVNYSIPSSPYLKFDDFKSIWDETDGLEECGDGAVMTPTRLQLSKLLPESASTASAIEAWVPIALGIIVFIGNLICIILLLISWRTMMEDSGRELARELTIKEEKLEKGIANPVFHYDNEAYNEEETEIMATEAEEDAAGSEEQLITTVYLVSGKTQSTITMIATDAPKDVEKAVGTDDDALILPPPPASKDYDSDEEMLDVYPFDEPDEDFDFKLGAQGGTVDIKTTPNVTNLAATPDRESPTKDPPQPVPPVDYETEKKKDGVENEEKKKEDQEEDQDTQNRTGSIDGKQKLLMSELEGHFSKGKEDEKSTTEDGNDSEKTEDGESSAKDPALPIPPVDYETETKIKDEEKNEGQNVGKEDPMGASTSGVQPGERLKDYDYPPPPVPLVQE